ncbi:PilW family protein [uncultured Nevskia sp.]|uniref:PilW family protein n=1 Tax=uncultured Nevskia sp. TaxID=228950 RepID=UPI0025ED8AA8|nr:PilW family protein [uncultured Nevskia sp.]
MSRSMIARTTQRGLSLVELMIAITLGLIVLVAILAVFSQNSRSFRQTETVAHMQDSARFALDSLARDLSMAGFYGGIYGASNITVAIGTQPTNDCGADATSPWWAFKLQRRVEFRNHTSATTVSTAFPCLGTATTPVVANTDIVAIRRVAGQATADISSGSSVQLRAGNFYLKTNGTVGSLIQNGNSATYQMSTSTDAPLQAPVTFWKYQPRVYFIRSYAETVGDGIPALCRMELQQVAGASMAVECLADGVENLQIEWGLDSDNDCVVDTYTSNPDADALAQTAITARIWLLVRSTDIDGGYTDDKTFNFGDYQRTQAQADSFHRRVYSTTVQLRTPVGDLGPCSASTAGATR